MDGFSGFYNRHGLALWCLVGEASSANIANVALTRQSIPIVLALLKAQPGDAFNADEIGIVLGVQPHKTLTASIVSVVKRHAERITVMLRCNAIGGERLKPLIIGKATKPRSWTARATPSFQPTDYVHYYLN